MVKILKLKFVQDSKALVRSEILKLKLKFGQYFEADILVELKLDKFAIRFESNYFGESTYPYVLNINTITLCTHLLSTS